MEAGAGTLSGRYETSERLGTGGMSNVYKATDRILERTVAVKILAEHLSDDERFVARFRREALAVAKLIHPNIVQVYDTGVDEGRHYIVMEYVEGRSGAQLLLSRGRLGPEVAVEISVLVARSPDEADFLAKGGTLVAETERAALEAAEAAQRAAAQAAALFEAKPAEGEAAAETPTEAEEAPAEKQ